MRTLQTLCWIICLIGGALPAWSAETAQTPAEYYGPVQANDTLWRIATRLRPANVSTKQMVIALQQTNPDAFAGGNFNKLIAGYTLRIPKLSEIRKISASQASALFQQKLDNPTAENEPDEIEPEPVATEWVEQPQDTIKATLEEKTPAELEKPTVPTAVEEKPLETQTSHTEIRNYIMLSLVVIGVVIGLLWRRFWRVTDYPSELVVPVAKPQAFLQAVPEIVPDTSETQVQTQEYVDATSPGYGFSTELMTEQQPYDIASLNANAGLDKPLEDLDVAFDILSAEETPAPTKTETAAPVQHDPVDDHIALASAYCDLGDTKSARELLEEARQRGNPDQQQRAIDLLEKLTT